MKQIHTHRAHCQLCTIVQAIDVATGIIAKHGYTVDHGYFSGTCPGSDLQNLHVDRTHADASIKRARADAEETDELVAKLRSGSIHPAKAWSGQYHQVPAPRRGNPDATRSERTMVPFGEADELHQRMAISGAIAEQERHARICRKHADELEAWADKITGKVDPYQVTDLEPRDWEVGDEVRIGGKGRDGWDAVIEAIEARDYSTHGFRGGRGTVKCKHAKLTRPAVPERRASEKAGGYVIREARPQKVVWVALRDIKRPPNTLATELRKAGKL
jgi:hypothetical protein